MMRILIVEDELPAADRVVSLLHKSGYAVEILGITTGVESTVNWLATHQQPDLILMDIQLEDGISFEIFEAVEVTAPVIFTTAYDVYALKAFSVNSIDYLLKPVDLLALQKALERYGQFFAPKKVVRDASSNESGIENPFRIPDWRKLIEQLAPPCKERFLVKCGPKFRSVLASQAAFFHSEEGITFLKTFDGHSYDIDYTLEQLETLLNPATFFRVSRSHIIHADAVADMIPLSGSKMKIKVKSDLSPEGILVSRDRLQAFKRWMDK